MLHTHLQLSRANPSSNFSTIDYKSNKCGRYGQVLNFDTGLLGRIFWVGRWSVCGYWSSRHWVTSETLLWLSALSSGGDCHVSRIWRSAEVQWNFFCVFARAVVFYVIFILRFSHREKSRVGDWRCAGPLRSSHARRLPNPEQGGNEPKYFACQIFWERPGARTVVHVGMCTCLRAHVSRSAPPLD
jgi:hypothetical protein